MKLTITQTQILTKYQMQDLTQNRKNKNGFRKAKVKRRREKRNKNKQQ